MIGSMQTGSKQARYKMPSLKKYVAGDSFACIKQGCVKGGDNFALVTCMALYVLINCTVGCVARVLTLPALKLFSHIDSEEPKETARKKAFLAYFITLASTYSLIGEKVSNALEEGGKSLSDSLNSNSTKVFRTKAQYKQEKSKVMAQSIINVVSGSFGLFVAIWGGCELWGQIENHYKLPESESPVSRDRVEGILDRSDDRQPDQPPV